MVSEVIAILAMRRIKSEMVVLVLVLVLMMREKSSKLAARL